MVEDARLALALLAAEFYRHPSRDMQVVGITGTNGKTTTAYLIASIFETAGVRSGILGTVAYRVGPGEHDKREAARTTPEAPDVQALLREMVDHGCGACAMEVSSPALSLRLVGRPNVYNILAAVAAASALDVPFDAIERGIRDLDGVPGRFEIVSTKKDEVTVVVDYAHTDDALRNLLETARPLTGGRLITVFGCGGDRDRTKRPLMGAVAGRLSDLIVITSDNPRSEDPNRIIEEIQRGITADTRKDSDQRVLTNVDRRGAIANAIELARAGDLVLIAGKGHEKYQVIGDRTTPFDDVAVAREALERRRPGA